MLNIFADTSALAAAANNSDPNHKKAVQTLDSLKEINSIPYTSTFILAEFMNICCRDLGKAPAVKLLNEVRSGSYIVINPDDDPILKAEVLFKSINSKNVSYTDCLSFTLMREYNIVWAFSFDVHFKKYGFKRLGLDGWPK